MRGVSRPRSHPGGAAPIGDRYEIRGRLGMGGMGVVYEAFDRQRGIRVALKSLRQMDATALAGVDLELAETSRGALLSLLVRRARLRLRGLEHQPRDASEVSPA